VTDLGTLPDGNDYTGSLVTFKEKINDGLYGNVTAQKYLPDAIAQNHLCIHNDPVWGTRCGATQANMKLKFWPKSPTATHINIVFETPAMRVHFYNRDIAPMWIGTDPSGVEWGGYPPYPPYVNYCRVWNTNHATRDNVSLVFMLPRPNSIQNGDVLQILD
jgi:hypothetical protein